MRSVINIPQQLLREMTANNEQQDIEIELMRVTVEGGAQRCTEDIIGCFSEQERQSVSEIQTTTRAHLKTINHLKSGYSKQTASLLKSTLMSLSSKSIWITSQQGPHLRSVSPIFQARAALSRFSPCLWRPFKKNSGKTIHMIHFKRRKYSLPSSVNAHHFHR